MKAFAVYGDPSVSPVTALVFANKADEACECAELSTGVQAIWLKAKRVPALDGYVRQGITHSYREYSPDYLDIAGLSSSGNHSIPASLDDCRRALIEERARSDMAWSVLMDLAAQLGIDPEEARKQPGDPAKLIMKKAMKSKVILERLRKKVSVWNDERGQGSMLIEKGDADWLCEQLTINKNPEKGD